MPLDHWRPKDGPFVRRKKLVGWLRSRSGLPARVFKLVEFQLSRISIHDPSLVTFDSIESAADGSGLCQRSVIFAHNELVARGMMLRFTHGDFLAWLDAIGRELGYRYPEHVAGTPSRFNVMLFHLSPADQGRAQACAVATNSLGDDGRASSAGGSRKVCAPGGGDLARRHPYRELGSIESSSENRRSDGSLDPVQEGDGKNPDSNPAVETRAGLESLAAGAVPSIARWARARLDLLGGVPLPSSPPPPCPEPPPEPPRPPDPEPAPPDVRALADRLLCASAEPGPSRAPAVRSRLAGLVLALPGAPAFKVASVTRALMSQFRDEGNEVTERCWRAHLDRVCRGSMSAELVAGLVEDACGANRPANHLSKALADEWDRVKNRSPVFSPKVPGDRSPRSGLTVH